MNRQKTLTIVAVGCLLLAGLAWRNKDRLPASKNLRHETWRIPVQTQTNAPPFSFSYRGRPYDVKPLADYELWGLIVSHNDIDAIADIYHDENAVDTLDVCTAWGEAAANPELASVEFKSGPFTCYFRYPGDVVFRQEHVSNNHLVTDDAAVREQISRLRIGDQIHVKGMLVSYRPADQPDNWRTSSLARTDTGNGACEVVFVKRLEVMKEGAPGWHRLWSAALIGLALCLLLKAALVMTGGATV